MYLHIRINKNIGLILDDTAYDQWLKNRVGETPTLYFHPYLRKESHKVTVKDVEEFNQKIDELWAKYSRFARYDKPEITKPQDLLGEDHALILT